MSVEEKDTKKHILNSSVTLFSTNGYKETSVRAISKEAGINVSMISYYFGGKDGILENIAEDITEGFAFILDSFDFDNPEGTIIVLRKFFEYLENNRPQIKILFFELGKGSEYFTPIKKKLAELQNKLSSFVMNKDLSGNSSELTLKLKVMTDILLGMIFSDYIFDFSSFQDGALEKENELWRKERGKMLIKMFEQLSGTNLGKLTFESIL